LQQPYQGCLQPHGSGPADRFAPKNSSLPQVSAQIAELATSIAPNRSTFVHREPESSNPKYLFAGYLPAIAACRTGNQPRLRGGEKRIRGFEMDIA